MTVALYLRKSRAEENESVEVTLARHKNTLLQFAESNNLEVLSVYDEVVSGDSLFARPAMLKLLDNIDQYQAILCMDIDRLGRGTMKEQGIILETIKSADVKIITPRKVYDLNNEMDETYGEFQAFMARQELKMIKSRMQRGIRRSAEEGCHMGAAPYGYKKVKLGKKPTLEIIPEEAEIVRFVFQEYLAGHGANAIAHTLNARGVLPQRITEWNRVTIQRMLSNDTYIGRITYGKFIASKRNGVKRTYRPVDDQIKVKGLHEAVISPEVFAAAQKIKQKNYRPPMREFGFLKNPFAGVVKCSVCGRALELRPFKEYRYLLCKTKGCVRMVNLKYVERAFLEELQRHMDEVRIKAAGAPALVNHLAMIQNMHTELNNLENQRERLFDFLERGIYTIDVFQKRSVSLAERIATLREVIDSETVKHDFQIRRVEVVVPQIQHVLTYFADSTPREKNELIKSVVTQVSYYKAKDAKPDDFLLTLDFLVAQ